MEKVIKVLGFFLKFCIYLFFLTVAQNIHPTWVKWIPTFLYPTLDVLLYMGGFICGSVVSKALDKQ